MSSKAKNRALQRRALRRAEKGSTLAQDKMMGGALRRRYGAGRPTESRPSSFDFDVVTDNEGIGTVGNDDWVDYEDESSYDG